LFVSVLLSFPCDVAVQAQEPENIESLVRSLEDLKAEIERAKRQISELENARGLQPDTSEKEPGESQSGSLGSSVAPEQASASNAPPQVVGSAPKDQPLSPEQQQQVGKAEELLKRGDVAGARLLFEYLLSTGNPIVAFKLAETYDPKRLAAWKVFGIRADPQKARELYQKAAAGGISEAQGAIAGIR
jgi:TPR repeat protein